MALQNSSNQRFSNNTDGWALGGGTNSVRTLTLAGNDFDILLGSTINVNDILQYNGAEWVNVPGTTFGTGSVTNIATGTGLTGGPITNAGTISMATSGVTAGSYGNGSNYATFTVDDLGRLTQAGTVALGGMAFQNPNSVNITGGTVTAGLNANGSTIVNVGNPVSSTDAVNKQYVDGIAQGLDAKQAVLAASTAPLTATYTSGTWTESTNGSLQLDGVSPMVGDRVLIKNETGTNEPYNGIFVVQATGNGSNPYVLVRSTDMNTSSEVPGAYTFVLEGSVNAGYGYVVVGFTPSDILDTNNIMFTQFSQAGAYSAASNGGLSINTSSVPALFQINFTNMQAAGPLGSTNLIPISQDGTNVVTTTIGSLAAEIAGASIVGTGAITVTSGTVGINTDSNFTQAGGTLHLANTISVGTVNGTTINGTTINGTTINAGTINSTGTINGTLQNNGTGVLYAVGTGLTKTGSDLGTVAMATSGVSAGNYTLTNLTVDALGRVTSATSTTVGSGLTFAADTLSANVDGSSIIDTGGPLAVQLKGTGGIASGATGLYLNISSLPADGTALGTADLIAVSHAGTTYTTTLGSLLTFITGGSTLAATVVDGQTEAALTYSSGTFTLNIDDTSIIDSGTGLAVQLAANSGLGSTATGLNLNLASLTTDPNALASNNLFGISSSGTTYSTTLGSIAAYAAANGVVANAPIVNTNGTLSLAYTTNFALTSGSLNLSTTGVTPGTYSQVVVDQYGRVTSGTSDNMSWINITTTTQSMSVNVGYVANNAALVTATLPATANFGDEIILVGNGAGGWKLAQNSGQTIHFGDMNTTTGTNGYIASSNRYDAIELVCTVANTDFVVRNSVGNQNVN